ncbi:MAG: TonB-dependent receptor [Bryobacteraceae bacterium]|nr:TonB-dependent receptor [Bryobacteraceae bacterium]
MRSRYIVGVMLAASAVFCGQLPVSEDLETKSRREPFQEGLDVREVRESSARDVGEALSKLEGIWKLRKGGIASDVVLRGFQNDNLNVLIDGARIYGACPGRMDPQAFHVDFAEVERVEITKGTFDLANQGSLGGSVDIIRKRFAPGYHFSPSLQTGSFGYFNPALAASAGSDSLEVSGGYSHRQSDPFRDGRGQRMTAEGGYRPEYMDDDAYRIRTGWITLRFAPARRQSGEVAYTRQDGANTLYPYLQMDSPYDIADRLSARYEWRELAGALERIRFHSYYSRVNHWMTDEKRLSSLGARDAFGMATYAHARVTGGRIDATFHNGLVAGLETFQRNWDAVNSFRTAAMVTDQNVIPNVNTTVAGAYLQWSKSVSDRLRLGAGARLDTANMYARSSSVNLRLFEAYKDVSNLRKRDTNPSASVHAAYGLTRSLEVFAGAGSTVRTPDAQERFFNHRRMGTDWVGNPALAPARNAEGTLGLNLRRRGFYLKPVAFYSRLSDFIVVHNQARIAPQPAVMNLAARSYANVDARIYGGELTYGIGIGPRWLVSGGASYSRAAKDPIPSLGILDPDVAEMPPLRVRTAVRYGARLWFAEAEGLAAGSQRRVDGDLNELPTAGYGVANLKCGLHAKRSTLSVGLDNVLNRYYVEHLSFQRDPFRSGLRVPEPGRNLFLTFAYAF